MGLGAVVGVGESVATGVPFVLAVDDVELGDGIVVVVVGAVVSGDALPP